MRQFSKMLLAFLWVPFISCSDDEIGGNIEPSDEQKPLNLVNVPQPNPYLAKEHYSITHFNSAQTDAFPYQVSDGTFYVDPNKCEGGWSGPVNLMTLSAATDGYMWGMSSDRVSYYRTTNGAFTKLGEAGLPSGTMKTEEQLRTLSAKYRSTEELYNAIADAQKDGKIEQTISVEEFIADTPPAAETPVFQSENGDGYITVER